MELQYSAAFENPSGEAHIRFRRRRVPAYAANGITGDPQPSESDIRLTRQLNAAARILQLHFLDHVIVGQQIGDRAPYFSFKGAALL
jgi:RadC-like JAB domain